MKRQDIEESFDEKETFLGFKAFSRNIEVEDCTRPLEGMIPQSANIFSTSRLCLADNAGAGEV